MKLSDLEQTSRPAPIAAPEYRKRVSGIKRALRNRFARVVVIDGQAWAADVEEGVAVRLGRAHAAQGHGYATTNMLSAAKPTLGALPEFDVLGEEEYAGRDGRQEWQPRPEFGDQTVELVAHPVSLARLRECLAFCSTDYARPNLLGRPAVAGHVTCASDGYSAVVYRPRGSKRALSGEILQPNPLAVAACAKAAPAAILDRIAAPEDVYAWGPGTSGKRNVQPREAALASCRWMRNDDVALRFERVDAYPDIFQVMPKPANGAEMRISAPEWGRIMKTARDVAAGTVPGVALLPHARELIHSGGLSEGGETIAPVRRSFSCEFTGSANIAIALNPSLALRVLDVFPATGILRISGLSPKAAAGVWVESAIVVTCDGAPDVTAIVMPRRGSGSVCYGADVV